MKFKKLMCVSLAVVMALSLAVTAFAAEVTDLTEGAELEVTGTTQGATISLTVPTSAAVVVNPYEMSVKIPGKETTSTDQIVSPIYFIENNSTLGIKVEIKATGITEGDAKLVAGAASVAGDAKNAYVYMAYEAVANNTVSAVDDTNKIVLATTAATGEVALEATDGTTGTATDVLAFTFAGQANGKAAAPWTSEDTISATVAFTFKVDNSDAPVAPTTYAITSAACATGTFSVDKSTAAENDTVTVTANSPTTGGQTATVTVAKDSDGTSVSVTDNGDGTFEFTMPGEAVTVTVAYA